MDFQYNDYYTPSRLAKSGSSLDSDTPRHYDNQNGKYENSVSHIKNRETIMKVFVNDLEDINSINEVKYIIFYLLSADGLHFIVQL